MNCRVCGQPYVVKGRCMGCGARQSGPKPDPLPTYSSLPLGEGIENVWMQGVPAVEIPAAVEYLNARGVSKEIIDQLDCRYMRHSGERIFFPLYRDRNVVGLHGRVIDLQGCPGLTHGHPEQGPPLPPPQGREEEGSDPSSGSRSPHEFRPRAFARPSLTPRHNHSTGQAGPVKGGARKYWTIGEDGVWLPRVLYRPASLFVCEGVFDALYFWPNGVAICGPLETPVKIRTLLSLQPGRIILVGDNDEACDFAARSATWRREDRSATIETLLPPAGRKDFGEVLCGG